MPGYRVQQLMTADLRKALPPLYANEDKDLDDVIVVAKFFHPYGAGTWFITEFDGEDTLFGYADLGMGGGEWGYIHLPELVELRARIGNRRMPFQAIERDEHWTPKPWREVKATLRG